jgi:Protein of unknown function (DUF3575)
MKQIIFLTLIFIVTVGANAQEQEKKNETKNEIGIDVFDIVDGTFQISYERMLGKHISINLGIGLKGKEGLFSISGVDRDQLKTNDITYSGFKIIPEVRYYLNKTRQYSMDGFYFGAYLKYSNFSSDLDGTYIDSSDTSFIVEFDVDINVTSVGFMIGYKLPVSKKFAIDFLIAGPGAGFYNFKLKNKRDLPEEFYDDLNQALEQTSLFDYLNGDFRFNSINTKTNFGLLSFRYGVSFGYSF